MATRRFEEMELPERIMYQRIERERLIAGGHKETIDGLALLFSETESLHQKALISKLSQLVAPMINLQIDIEEKLGVDSSEFVPIPEIHAAQFVQAMLELRLEITALKNGLERINS
jgi:hypothetical protein